MEKAPINDSDSESDIEMQTDKEDKDWEAEQEYYMNQVQHSKEKMSKKLKEEQK